ncbi:hypothetical protein SPRG_22202, partial [Saprolegnia parasitica CBS 223.65]
LAVDPVSTDQPTIPAHRRSSAVTTPDVASISQAKLPVQPLPPEVPPLPSMNLPISQHLPANSSTSQPLPQDLPSNASMDLAKALPNDAAPPTTRVKDAVRRPSIPSINPTSTARRPTSIATVSIGPNVLQDIAPAAVDPLSPPAVTPPAASRPRWALPTPTPPSTSYNFQVFPSTPTVLSPSTLGHSPSGKQPTSPLGSYSPPMPSPRTMSLGAKLPIDVEINAMHYLLFGSRKSTA